SPLGRRQRTCSRLEASSLSCAVADRVTGCAARATSGAVILALRGGVFSWPFSSIAPRSTTAPQSRLPSIGRRFQKRPTVGPASAGLPESTIALPARGTWEPATNSWPGGVVVLPWSPCPHRTPPAAWSGASVYVQRISAAAPSDADAACCSTATDESSATA